MPRIFHAVLLVALLSPLAANAADVQDRIVQSIQGKTAIMASTPGPSPEIEGRYEDRLAAAISPPVTLAPARPMATSLPIRAFGSGSDTQARIRAAIIGG